jgi:hypothetical protein
MNRRQIKNFVRQTLLEVVNYPCEVEVKLLSNKMWYGGVERDVVFEGTVDDANSFASEKGFTYNTSTDSFGGGYYGCSDGFIYEFHPSPEFYGEMMEADSTASQTLRRISGLSDRVLSEMDESLVTKLTEFIAKDRELYEGRVVSILNNLKERRSIGLFDERNAIRLWGVLVKEGFRKYSTEVSDITEIGDLERDAIARNLDKFYTKHHENLFETESPTDVQSDLEERGVQKFGGPLVTNIPAVTVRTNDSLFY